MNAAFVFRRVQAVENNVSSLCNWVASIGGGQGGDTSALARSADVSSFYALKTSLPSVAPYATSADVSSAQATFATSLGAAGAYQPKGVYPSSLDVSSFYALKSALPSVAPYATSADVSSGFATFPTSIAAAAAYQPKGVYPSSLDVSSFYALKSALPSVAGLANSSDVSSFYALKTSLPSVAGFANSVDVASTYDRFMGGMDVWSLAAPASRTIANSIAWSFCVTSTTITSAFLVMPQSPFDGQECGFSTVGAITFMTQTVATGVTQTIFNKLAAATAGLAAQWKWHVNSKAWFRTR